MACILTLLSLCADTDHFHEWLPDFTSEMSEMIKDLRCLLQSVRLRKDREQPIVLEQSY